MSNADAQAFAKLPPEGFARIEGVDDDPSDWHINEHFVFSAGADPLKALLSQFTDGDIETPDAETTHALVFQRGDASEEWFIVVVVQNDDGEWSFDKQYLADVTPGDYEEVEGDIAVLDHAPNKSGLESTD